RNDITGSVWKRGRERQKQQRSDGAFIYSRKHGRRSKEETLNRLTIRRFAVVHLKRHHVAYETAFWPRKERQSADATGRDPETEGDRGDVDEKAGIPGEKIEQELTTAKKYGTKNKRAALLALKRKKRFEKQLEQIDGTLSTIEFQREALENANTNTEVLKNMGFAAKALKQAHNSMDVDDVHDLMDDIAEQQELANEISTAISTPAGFGMDMDEDELLAELEELEQEELDQNLLTIDTNVDTLPSVPSTSLPSNQVTVFSHLHW
uniref:Charged multivesicular body protein 4b n=1 Tax=Neogobius melanostomus TaxID=47308 RepID=A0A8C6T866_9GOBI